MAQTKSGTLGSLSFFSGSESRHLENLMDLALTSNAFPGKQGIGARSCEALLGDVCSGFERRLLASSLRRTYQAAWPGCRDDS